MQDQQVNFNPYGGLPPGRELGPLWIYDDPGAATERARHKLSIWQHSNKQVEPISKDIKGTVALGVLGAALLSGQVFMWAEGGLENTWVFLLILGVLFAVGAVTTYLRSGPKTPLACMQDFTRNVRNNPARAYSLLAPVDKDAYQRPAPTKDQLTPAEVKRFSFDSLEGFKRYCRKAMTMGATSPVVLQVDKMEHFITQDIAVVTVLMHIHRSFSITVTKPKPFRIPKLLLRYGREWRVFDGELLSSAEANHHWLQEAVLQLQS